MSRSYHVTRRALRGKTRQELDEMAADPNSLLAQWAKKSAIKKAVRKERKSKKK